MANYFGGAFGRWIRTAWSEVVGSTGMADDYRRKPLEIDVQHHVIRGVDVIVIFSPDEADAATDRSRVARYLAGEAAKWRQKNPTAQDSPGWAATSGTGRGVGFLP